MNAVISTVLEFLITLAGMVAAVGVGIWILWILCWIAESHERHR